MLQGDEATSSMVKAIKKIHQNLQDFDLITIIRGGGSQVDLDCFDSYLISAEIARCKLPVVTGIGHLRDDTVADLVAHTNLKTPTAVAEFLINGMAAFETQLNYQHDRIKELAAIQLEKQRSLLFALFKNLDHGASTVVNRGHHTLDLLSHKIKSGVKACIKENENQLDSYLDKLFHQSFKMVDSENKALQLLETKISLADPVNILKRGYSITYVNGQLIKSQGDIKQGDQLETRLSQTKINSTVTSVHHDRAKDNI